MPRAWRVHVEGTVQGVGFRPFVYRLALEHGLSGWVLNSSDGVHAQLEGEVAAFEAFRRALEAEKPPAATLSAVQVEDVKLEGFTRFEIRESQTAGRPTTRVSPDLAVCEACLLEMRDPTNRRYRYPYINCTDCGPRHSIITGLPYDRPNTTMQPWRMCPDCQREYDDPLNRRFHAQPIACPVCGPKHSLLERLEGDWAAIEQAAQWLREGRIIAVKGLGGYHLACDALNPAAVNALRQRKYRKEKPFALMARDLETAEKLVYLEPATRELLQSTARPIVLAPARLSLSGVSPENSDLGLMLPCTPLQHLLFDAGAPAALVMTSANRSSEPIAYRDQDALEQLSGIADAFLMGERPIARRVDDSIARVSAFGWQVMRRARGYAPASTCRFPPGPPILALGADLKSSVTLVVNGEAFVGQHLGDLEHLEAYRAFEESARDLLALYELEPSDVTLVHDLHPQYRSSQFAASLETPSKLAVQHHRAHIASVLAEHGLWEARALGVSLDGTGYGDDGAIWGFEAFAGSLATGLERIAHLRQARLAGGDAAAQHPVQAAAGFLEGVQVDFSGPPFAFPVRFQQAQQLLARNLRVFPTTSAGRLFDTAAALLGFTRAISFEGQAAIWLEHLARDSRNADSLELPFDGREWNYEPLLESLIQQRLAGRDPADLARGFVRGIANGLARAARELCEQHDLEVVALSGGVFQNALLLEQLYHHQFLKGLRLLVNRGVPPNDGGISLGQAALVAVR